MSIKFTQEVINNYWETISIDSKNTETDHVIVIAQNIPEILNKELISYKIVNDFTRQFFLKLKFDNQNLFILELEKSGYFNILKNFLYSNNFGKVDSAIYTFGKLSQEKFVDILENAYEETNIKTDFRIRLRALMEMYWLKSNKVSQYLEQLKSKPFGKITLFEFYDSTGQNSEDFLKDPELLGFLKPNHVKCNNSDIKILLLKITTHQHYSKNEMVSSNDELLPEVKAIIKNFWEGKDHSL